MRSALQNVFAQAARRRRLCKYKWGGRVPWSAGYDDFKFQYIENLLNDPDQAQLFLSGQSLPDQFGVGLDERVIEYPWTFVRLKPSHRLLLDAGSALNHRSVLQTRQLEARQVVLCTLAPEHEMTKKAGVSYVFCDLRNTLFRDETFDAVTCISTLEHIGMDAAMFYTADRKYHEHDLSAYKQAIVEIRRVLKPGGDLLLTVPFGKPGDYGWLQQYDRNGIDEICKTFTGETVEIQFYRYRPEGWQISTAQECSDCVYFDFHSRPDSIRNPEKDFAAAARAIACIHLRKMA
jgi:SAM-dependent methyltransferase